MISVCGVYEPNPLDKEDVLLFAVLLELGDGLGFVFAT
jgi:hypothetical protein